MSMISYIFKTANQWIWGTSNDALQPSDVFQQNLSKLSSKQIDKSVCIENCSQYFDKLLSSEDCSLSEQSLRTIQSHLKNFMTVLDTIPQLSQEQNILQTEFKQALRAIVEKKWIARMAAFFYPIPMITDKEEQMATAMGWAHAYFAGLNCLNQWETPDEKLNRDFEFEEKMQNAFQTYSSDMINQNIQRLLKQGAHQSFDTDFDQAKKKFLSFPNALTAKEYEHLQLRDSGAKQLVNRNCNWLKTCIDLTWFIRKNPYSFSAAPSLFQAKLSKI